MTYFRKANPRLIVLLTDFGWGHYVGVMKGVILNLCLGARIVDLDHEISPHNVREGAWRLLTSYRYFPRGSIFLAVVDPGVGTTRQALAAKAGGYFFVGPDNGLLYPAVAEAGLVEAVALPIPPEASRTFHGRDVFAPAAARLAGGWPLKRLGVPTSIQCPLEFRLCGRRGEVVAVDRFGNVITNLPPLPGKNYYRVSLSRGGTQYFQAELPAFPTYAAAPEGVAFLIVGSNGTLEISVNRGSAADLLRVQPGDLVEADSP